jgi:hypothetical protein
MSHIIEPFNTNKIQVIKLNQIPETYQPCELFLGYPPNWFSPIKLSPFARSVEEKTIQWFKALGIINSIEEEKYIRKMEPRYYAGYTVPLGNYENVLLQCMMLTIWLTWDDRRVEKAKDIKEILPELLALKGEVVEGNDPYTLGMKHIGDELERLGASKHYRRRVADGFEAWSEVAIKEAQINQTITLEQTLSMRMLTIGIIPTAILYERVIGTELPEVILNNPLLQKLIKNLALIVAIQNDIMSTAKDILNNQIVTNIVISHNKEYSTTIGESFQAILDIHDQAVREFDYLANQFLDQVEEEWKERLAMFINQLRYSGSGFALWHANTVRYRENVITNNEVYYTVRVGMTSVPPTMK